MNQEMMKSLVALIDESLAEIEELKKSDRFSASEIKIEGPGSGIAGKPVNGSMGKDEDKDDEEDEDEAKKSGEGQMDKGEGQNRQADPNGGHHVAKGETGMPEGTAKKSDMDKGEGQNRQADPNGGHHVAKADDDKDEKKKKKDDDEDEDGDDKKMAFLKKSTEQSNTLLKSYVDQSLAPIKEQMNAIMNLVKQVADAPAPARGASYKSVTPLKKSSDEEGTSLTKSMLVDKLLELKKSGSRVDSVDITSAELGGSNELAKIANKYNIK